MICKQNRLINVCWLNLSQSRRQDNIIVKGKDTKNRYLFRAIFEKVWFLSSHEGYFLCIKYLFRRIGIYSIVDSNKIDPAKLAMSYIDIASS